MQHHVTTSATNTGPGVEDLSVAFADAIATQHDPLIDHLHWLWPAVWRILADGHPASAAEIAELSGRPLPEVSAVIAKSRQAEVDRDGRVLGVGLTLIPTPHRVTLPERDHALYVWCVPDAFVVSSLLNVPLQLMTRCRGTGQPLMLDVRPDEVRSVDPPEAVVSFVQNPSFTDLRGTICQHQHLFASRRAAESWLSDRPNATVLPVREALQVLGPVLEAATVSGSEPEHGDR